MRSVRQATSLRNWTIQNCISLIRESENRRSSRVCYSKCWYAPTYMQRKHGQKYEKVVADSGYESLATTAGSKKMGRPLSLSLTITNLVRSIPLRLRSAEWKTWATTNRMTALSARMADIWTMFQNTQKEKYAPKNAPSCSSSLKSEHLRIFLWKGFVLNL